ncbi:hypothetical protein NRIC_12220 [Enterococcus florum]|uniref:Uncharacterized protein n=1 Tax=Enterococcus florum TaxID=2480627 RepID=A0A4P5PAP6_9ENTE|nr:hypothetical protein NRIC_12220 [Enterococcus florum]
MSENKRNIPTGEGLFFYALFPQVFSEKGLLSTGFLYYYRIKESTGKMKGYSYGEKTTAKDGQKELFNDQNHCWNPADHFCGTI